MAEHKQAAPVFLRDVGRHFSVNRMLTMDSVKLRLERDQPLTFLEFNYMILQSYDFVELNKRYGCVLQMGGSDQWGNIVNGIDLGRRMGTPQLHALTTPLITTANGEKMGKTASGAVIPEKQVQELLFLSQVENLIHAMAAFAAHPLGATSLPSNDAAQFEAVIAPSPH